MSENVAQIYTAIRVRLSPAQIAVIAPGMEMITRSYRTRQHSGTSPLSYPFAIHPPPRGFDRGQFNQIFMDNFLDLGERLRTKAKTGKSVQTDTFQLRATVFAIRAYIDFVRLLRRQERLKRSMKKVRLQLIGDARLPLDDRFIAQLKAKSQRVIRSLERHMKRANRTFIAASGREQYSALKNAWKAHLRWMRLHIAYCKPWSKPIPGLRKRQQQDLDDLIAMAKRGLRNARYQAPEENRLRQIIRLYARYARSGLQGHWTLGFMLANKASFTSTYYLAQFVIERSKLKELSKS